MTTFVYYWHPVTQIQDAKVAKNRHLGNIAQLCRATSWQLRHVSTIGKTLLNSNIASICLSSEDIAEIERLRDVTMATNFGTALAIQMDSDGR